MYSKIALYSLFQQPVFCLIFVLDKNKGFQSGALLKTPPSLPSVEELGLDFQKQLSLNEQRIIFPKITKTHK